jgi:hypothetical protein
MSEEQCTGDHEQEIISREMYVWSCLLLNSVLNLYSYLIEISLSELHEVPDSNYMEIWWVGVAQFPADGQA